MRTDIVVLTSFLACAPAPKPAPDRVLVQAGEEHLGALLQLTHGGENAEAYWSPDGKELTLQARGDDDACDRIYRMKADGSAPMSRVSKGDGAHTCAFMLPAGEIIYSETPKCPPKPDQSKGYVWGIHKEYEIYKDGKPLTQSPGYDAEATVCKKDGSIVFTSVRDGDLELYRMDQNGQNVKRLTFTPGYDGGAFFSDDCTKIVWRASRPELTEYRALLEEGLVRPSKLELYVMNADGSDQHQVTFLNAASFAPYFFPNGKRIIFSSNYGDPKGREFDLWAIDVDGTHLERITKAPGFDGFPMFSPDGKRLAFSSNRATAPGKHDTNVFVAEWLEPKGTPEAPRYDPATDAAERLRADTFALSEKTDGRAPGSKGFADAAAIVRSRLQAMAAEGRLQAPIEQPFEAKTADGVVQTTNTYAVLPGTNPKLPPLVIGAHLDHLGHGGKQSLDPGSTAAHIGADDNASGSATLLEIARALVTAAPLDRSVYFVWFSAEELGVIGSSQFVRELKPAAFAMLNLDMVGRLGTNKLTVLGAGSAKEWETLIAAECAAARVDCNGTGDGYGPSDQTPFYAAGSPVLHFFTGAHSDYHKPSDTPDKLSYGGMAQVASIVIAMAKRLGTSSAALTYVASTKPQGPGRGPMKVSLGTVPDYGGPPPGVVGMLIQGVRAQSPAEKAGIKRGDVLVKLGKYEVKSVEDLMTALTELQPGETTAAVLRDGKRVEVKVTLEEKK